MPKRREEVPQEARWDVESLYASFKEWEADFEVLAPKGVEPFGDLLKLKGMLATGEEALAQALDLATEVDRKISKLYTYAHLRHDEDLGEEKAKNAYERITTLYHQFAELTSWMEPEILHIPEEKFQKMLSSDRLAPYRFHLEKLVRMRPYTLSESEERLLALSGQPLQAAGKAFSAFNNADLKFPSVKDTEGKEHPLTHATYMSHLRSTDRELRKNAFEVMHGSFESWENSVAEMLSGQIQSHVFSAKARGFDSCLHAALYPKNLDTKVYRSLIRSVRNNLPALHDYVSLRKELMGVDELHLYDGYAPIVKDVDFSFAYDEAEALVVESVAPLGKAYQQALDEGMRNGRWVDRYENLRKRSGAYSSGCYDSCPYILMNYENKLSDVMTLAHEAGHSMHSLLSNKNQSYIDHQYPIFLAEIASTFNEEMLFELLLKRESDPMRRAYLINQKIDDIRATFFRQTMFAEFELSLHEWAEQGIPLTPTFLKEQYRQLNMDYFGTDMVVDEAIDIEWARIPHFYYNFYVYQYATGISAAHAFVDLVKRNGDSARDAYLKFLSSGGSKYPLDILNQAGVDLASSAPIEAMVGTFRRLTGELRTALS